MLIGLHKSPIFISSWECLMYWRVVEMKGSIGDTEEYPIVPYRVLSRPVSLLPSFSLLCLSLSISFLCQQDAILKYLSVSLFLDPSSISWRWCRTQGPGRLSRIPTLLMAISELVANEWLLWIFDALLIWGKWIKSKEDKDTWREPGTMHIFTIIHFLSSLCIACQC